MPQLPDNAEYSVWPHRLAVLLVCATFPLIGVGSLVTTYGAGMAVPDWPTTYGYNLFLYPWQTWISAPFDLFVEHGHRLFGALVGMLTIALTLVIWYRDPRGWVKGLAIAALGLVIFQGLLGGARVRLNERFLAMAHGSTAPLFFSLSVALAAVTSKCWRQAPRLSVRDKKRLHAVGRLGVLCTAFAYFQLVLGAQVRHVPATSSFGFFRVVVFAHIAMAAVLLVHVALLAARTVRWKPPMAIRRLSVLTVMLLVAQVILGLATWVMKYSWPAWVDPSWVKPGHLVQAMGFGRGLVTTGHVVNGSLIMAVCLLVSVRSFRSLRQANSDDATRSTSRLEETSHNGLLEMGAVV